MGFQHFIVRKEKWFLFRHRFEFKKYCVARYISQCLYSTGSGSSVLKGGPANAVIGTMAKISQSA